MPVGVDVTFSCEISDGVNPHWVINNNAFAFSNSVERASRQGFLINKQNKPDRHTTLTLRVNATEEKNGTEIFCSSSITHSNTAVLLTISGK